MNQKRPKQMSHGWPILLHKFFRIMRLATFFIIIGCMHVSATAWPQTANSTMSVSLKKVPLEEALTTIAEKSGYHLLYNDEKLANTDAHVSIKIRSEEHTSELQSLMRISYAVFCLKKKKTLH